ncbi:MAG: hypothetical protein Hals2KO_39250 [Halioglobus sp.]
MVDTPETRSSLAGYYELVSTLDADIGTLLELLDKSPAAKDTVVVYTSDHGAGFPFEKWTNYDAGLRVPLIVRYRGVVAPGSRTRSLVSLMDLLPTFLQLAGGEAIENLDGESFLQVLKNPQEQHHKYVFGTHTTLGIVNATDPFPIRSVRSDRYRYIQNLNPQGLFTNNITEKGQGGWFSWVEKARSDEFARQRVAAYQRRPAEEFYDLGSDPFELNNLAADPDVAGALLEHKAVLQDWRESQQDQGLNHPGSGSVFAEMAWHATKSNVEQFVRNYLD